MFAFDGEAQEFTGGDNGELARLLDPERAFMPVASGCFSSRQTGFPVNTFFKYGDGPKNSEYEG